MQCELSNTQVMLMLVLMYIGATCSVAFIGAVACKFVARCIAVAMDMAQGDAP